MWWWLLMDEVARQQAHVQAVKNGTATSARDGSFIQTALGHRAAGNRASPLLFCGVLLPVQALFYLLRQLVDYPNSFPHLTLVSVFRDSDQQAGGEGRAECLEVRIKASFPASMLCPVQTAVGNRVRASFERGVVAINHPDLNPMRPAVYRGRFRFYIPCSAATPRLQPAGLLESALARIRDRASAGGFDLKAVYAVWLPGPKKNFVFGSRSIYTFWAHTSLISGRKAGVVQRDFQQIDVDEAEHYGNYTLGLRHPHGAWTHAAKEFMAQGGRRPGLPFCQSCFAPRLS